MIRIILIDDATDLVIGESDVEQDSLPDSFLSDTLLHISDQDWSVVEAEPLSREDFLKSRKVVLKLRRVEHENAAKILFSLPTICDPVPGTDGPLLEGRELLLHEDDWRQVEFLSLAQEGLIDEELGEVAQILGGSRTEAGFRDIHVRKRIEHPLRDARLTLDDLRQASNTTAALGAAESRVVLPDSSHCVTQSFSFFLTRRFALYGLAHDDRVEVLAAARVGDEWQPPASIDPIRRLAEEHDLLLVDWCGARKARAHDADFETILTLRD